MNIYRDISRHEPQGSVQVHRLVVTETTATDSVSVVASVLHSWRVLTAQLTHDNHAIRTALALRPIPTGYAYAIPSMLKLTVCPLYVYSSWSGPQTLQLVSFPDVCLVSISDTRISESR